MDSATFGAEVAIVGYALPPLQTHCLYVYYAHFETNKNVLLCLDVCIESQ